ncbi:50S ribosomal protein L4 [Candidatus Woesearchaeota archaeon]|nr:50S ribosomal protein L4 [Candidatus Woesearchaeota archaeon]
MKLTIFDTDNKETGKIDLPDQFEEELRIDLIRRAFRVIMNNNRQAYGADERAGLRHSAEVSRRRHKYRGSYGFGISRVPRKVLSRRGTRFNWVGAVAPGTVGGRKAHPPKPSKDYSQKINIKEKRKAIRSAISATVNKDIVAGRGHKIPESFPFIIDGAEKTEKTADLMKILKALGLDQEIERISVRKIRAGKGKSRGRKYNTKIGPLIVVSDEKCPLIKAASNIIGVEVAYVKNLNVSQLAPGADAGRLTLWSKGAIEMLQKEGLFK